ncbi:hypothetical protein GX586_10255 [bacterium]|nr:hypothetical protein [bacterium]
MGPLIVLGIIMMIASAMSTPGRSGGSGRSRSPHDTDSHDFDYGGWGSYPPDDSGNGDSGDYDGGF